ncbi:MAPEG family protein [Paraneptunicella aestuarii]|uniref:MAPEG family protein n=1 Tax=Paraneptunicella aestuarii TaxID=2831148 RepID=UPI001E4F3F13|nr:MAPEG family protein [Paraneptunicella aestuarii]UAA40123.1 MAPEG family protein [Paraneptunicella aestuarii]
MESNIALLQPVVLLVLWSLIMWLWMYATRIPAIISAKMKLDPNAPSGSQMAQLPANVRWKADNYNHLMEQPTIFYAIVLALVFLGNNSDLSIYAAWAYTVLRIIHSLVQVTINKIELRFAIFVLSNVPLFVLTINAALRVFA